MTGQETTTVSPAEFASAMLGAARKLGLEGTFLRMVAAGLPDESWESACEVSDIENNCVRAVAQHCCPVECSGHPAKCLTALKIEELVSKAKGRPFAAEVALLQGSSLAITLHPVE